MRYKKSEYSKKLLNPLWQKKRLVIMNRDNFTCQSCSDTETTLHVHHKYYEDGLEPWDYPDESLITLCSECHSIETEMLYESSKTLILAFKKSGFMAVDLECLSQILLDPTNLFLRPVLKEMLFQSLYSEHLATSMYENWIGYKKQVEEVLNNPLDFLNINNP